MELQPPLRRFECTSCHGKVEKRDPRITTELHECPAQHGLVVPLVELLPGQNELTADAGHHVVVEREDYVGDEEGLRYANGRPIMAVRTERPDGTNDCTVYPAAAIATTPFT